MENVTYGTVGNEDLAGLLDLYTHLHASESLLAIDGHVSYVWAEILARSHFHYVVARTESRVVSTCALTIIPNLTRGARPYGLIENMVTHPNYRRQGIGTQVLAEALDIAWSRDCYKVMLLTGKSDENTLRFYEKAGFIAGEKTGFVARPPK